MIAIILAAGYATRLYPYTKDMPKSLLEVGGKTILARILEKIEPVASVVRTVLVTNSRFHALFEAWIADHWRGKPVKILDDGTTTNETRIGAIADLAFAVDREGITEDVLVLAGDNLFDFELEDFVNYFHHVGHDAITAHFLADHKALRQTGVVEVDDKHRVLSFQEKPALPRSNLAAPPFYIYRRDTLPLVAEYLREGGDPDAPGSFIPWLIRHRDVYAYLFRGARYDIGTVESYELVKRLFADRAR